MKSKEEWAEWLRMPETQEALKLLEELAHSEAWDMHKRPKEDHDIYVGRIQGIEDAKRTLEEIGE